MSIINEALKKARREAGARENLPPDPDDTVIHPRKRVTSKPSVWVILPVALLFLLVIGLIGGLGFFLYREYFQNEAQESDGSPPKTEVVQEETTTTPATETSSDSIQAATPDTSTPASSPETSGGVVSSSPAPASPELLDQFEINGVMRRNSSVRILTNSGVYRVGDTISSPSGYTIEEIGESQLTLRGPDGSLYHVPLP